MIRLVDAVMICYAVNGKYVPENERQLFTVKITEVSAYVTQIIADNSNNAVNIAETVFKINKNMFHKEVTINTTECNNKKKMSQERIRQAFSRYDP